MLDTTTKRRIDTARDILVGKVPDPKSQVEQITIALIYKFMDDMDARSEELGGKRAFFSGEYNKYGWKKLMSKELSGFEVLNLYAEAIQKMNLNPNIPQLFRDIFKNAFLPYRDPETLKSFLKIIDDFEYDHSEKLGDAFEYLLSVLGSQGDAGQFRTPRHIIDFMVEVIDPKKEDRILDPACGTAGFLISSYKHIVKHNSSNYNPEKDKDAFEVKGVDLPELTANGNVHYNGDKLTPDERTRLSKNITGYDISPDMVRLSLVNLYLHGFTDPKIYEYDTLTSEDNWNEYADVILANPPFMSPKGGIKPHKRFSIQSSRSEVLFVDYMAEHLTTNGRAAIIVPEGIIFQSGTAYKQLRKMLLENYLYAVVSLPAGMFNPYSGVKTSILLMDKTLNKKTENILFVKIENDGFELGAQRRAKTGSQLPQAVKIIKDYINLCHTNFELSEIEATLKEKHGETSLWNITTKSKIAEKEEYNLSVERYKKELAKLSSFKYQKLEEIFLEIRNGINVNQQNELGKYRVTRIETIADGTINLEKTKFTDDEVPIERFMKQGDILLSHINSFEHLAKSAIYLKNDDKVIHGINLLRFRPDSAKIIPLFASYIFKSNNFIAKARTYAQKAVNQASIKSSDLKNIQIPLPPLEIQKEIVEEIEGYQKIINGARQVVENYKPHIDIDPTWEMVELAEACNIQSGGTPSREIKEYWGGDIPWAGSTVCKDVIVDEPTEFITKLGLEKSAAKLFPKGTTLIALVGATIGKTGLLNFECATNQNIAGLYPKNESELLPEYLFYVTQTLYNEFMKLGEGKFRMANLSFIKTLKIPLPNIQKQTDIVHKIKIEQDIVNSNSSLIKIFEQKIKDRISKVWGE